MQGGALFCRPGHPIEGSNKIDLGVLRRYGVAAISATHSVMEHIAVSYGFDSAHDFPLTVECDDLNLLGRLVADTDVLGFLPDGLAEANKLDLRRLEFKVQGARGRQHPRHLAEGPNDVACCAACRQPGAADRDSAAGWSWIVATGARGGA